MRRIIVLRGKANTGKTTKVNQVARWIIASHNASNTISLGPEDSTEGTFGVLTVNKLSIGVNCKGDWDWEVKKIDELLLPDGTAPDIIICTCRTRGKGYQHIVQNYNYANGWLAKFIKVHDFPNVEDQENRDSKILHEIKTRITGLEKL